MKTIYRHRTALRIRCREYGDIDDKLLVAPSQAHLSDHVLPYERVSTFDFPGLKINGCQRALSDGACDIPYDNIDERRMCSQIKRQGYLVGSYLVYSHTRLIPPGSGSARIVSKILYFTEFALETAPHAVH